MANKIWTRKRAIIKCKLDTSLFEDKDKGERTRQAEHERQVNELYNEAGRLTTHPTWLKKPSYGE